MDKPNILIAGCGDVGGELARQLLHANQFNVWGLRRSIDQLPKGVQPIQGDLADPDHLGVWPDKIDYVFYTAAADGYSPELYRQAYVTGLTNVIRRLKKNSIHPKRIIFTSSTSVYHQKDGQWVDEQSECQPTQFSGKILLEAENTLLNSKLPSTSIRFGGIYGPGRNRMINRVLEGKGCPEFPAVFSNRIHRDDCAGIISWLIQMDMAGKDIASVYLGVDNKPVPLHEVLHWMAEQKNITLDDNHTAPPRSSKRCSNQLLLDTGYRFKYPTYKEGYKELLKA